MRERMRKYTGAKEQSLSLLIQQAWNLAKSDMSDKMVTVCEMQAETRQINFPYVIIFLIMNAPTCLLKLDC